MSRFAILIYEDPTYYETMTPEGWGGVIEAHNTFTAKVVELGGSIAGGGALAPVATAATLKAGTVTDGPFFTNKEALLGYYVVEARDIAHAIEMARFTPASGGGVEIRPLVDPNVANPF